MKKQTQKRVDMYDIGDDLMLMNVITKNENGKIHQITTYVGIEDNAQSRRKELELEHSYMLWDGLFVFFLEC